MQRILPTILVAFLVIWLPRFCLKQTDGFTMLKIKPLQSKDLVFDIASPDLPDVFSQPFSYLGKGGQVYAFVSDDGNYVLKFLRQRKLSGHLWQNFVPFLDTQKLKRKKNRLRDLSSYKISMENLANETGLLFIHMNQTNHLKTKAIIKDKLNIVHLIELDRIPFILQRKAVLAFAFLDDLIERGQWEQAKTAIASICDLIISRCQKGIHDIDHGIERNIGFVDGKAIIIDIGRFKQDPRRLDPDIQRHDLIEITKKLEKRLCEKSPQLAHFLTEYINTKEL